MVKIMFRYVDKNQFLFYRQRETHFPNLRLFLSIRTFSHSNTKTERVFSLILDAKSKEKKYFSMETNSICIIRYALKDNKIRLLALYSEHLNLMENIYENLNFESRKTNLHYMHRTMMYNNTININSNRN